MKSRFTLEILSIFSLLVTKTPSRKRMLQGEFCHFQKVLWASQVGQ